MKSKIGLLLDTQNKPLPRNLFKIGGTRKGDVNSRIELEPFEFFTLILFYPTDLEKILYQRIRLRIRGKTIFCSETIVEEKKKIPY